jgi:hypothetical protein
MLRSRDEGIPLVSVVTVVRNGVASFRRTAESVWSQTYPAVEYIVIDGGSTDGTRELIESLGDHIDLWISEPDEGISDAFNKGIALARGEVIGLVNSDDWYEPDAVAAAVTALERSGADIAFGKLQYWSGGAPTYLVTGDCGRLEQGMTIGHPTVFARRALYDRVGLFRVDYRQAMDYEWLLRARGCGATFVNVERCLANMETGGIGDRGWRRSLAEVARARAAHLPGADRPFARGAFVAWHTTKGVLRRALDRLGLSAARDAYYRLASDRRVLRARDDD